MYMSLKTNETENTDIEKVMRGQFHKNVEDNTYRDKIWLWMIKSGNGVSNVGYSRRSTKNKFQLIRNRMHIRKCRISWKNFECVAYYQPKYTTKPELKWETSIKMRDVNNVNNLQLKWETSISYDTSSPAPIYKIFGEESHIENCQ